jgi:type IV pilus assembly protein PilW
MIIFSPKIQQPNLCRHSSGFTLIELLIVIAISSILMLVVGNFFISTKELNIVQEQIADTQQSVRAAMEIMGRDIRMAGLDPTSAGIVGFVDNGTDSTDTDQNSITIQYDYDGDGTVGNDPNDVNRSYYYNIGTQTFLVWNTGDIIPQPLTEATISSVTFNYTLDDGTQDSDPTGNGNLPNIKVVTVTICGMITGTYQAKYVNRSYCFSNTIKPRNM